MVHPNERPSRDEIISALRMAYSTLFLIDQGVNVTPELIKERTKAIGEIMAKL